MGIATGCPAAGFGSVIMEERPMQPLRLTRVFSMLLVLVGLLLALPGGALAAPTDKKPADNVQVFTIDEVDQIPVEACGFPLQVHVSGWIKVRFPRTSQQGVIEVDSFHIKLLWENPANGKTSDVTEGFTQKVIDN